MPILPTCNTTHNYCHTFNAHFVQTPGYPKNLVVKFHPNKHKVQVKKNLVKIQVMRAKPRVFTSKQFLLKAGLSFCLIFSRRQSQRDYFNPKLCRQICWNIKSNELKASINNELNGVGNTMYTLYSSRLMIYLEEELY